MARTAQTISRSNCTMFEAAITIGIINLTPKRAPMQSAPIDVKNHFENITQMTKKKSLSIKSVKYHLRVYHLTSPYH